MPGRSTKQPSESVVEKIIRRIKLNILNGGYAAGQRLIEADVQRMTGASRGPVREAMKRLAAEGLLEIFHQKGARVRHLTREEIENLYDVRELMEGLAARKAAAYARDPQFRKQLSEVERSFSENYDGSPTSYMKYNERFHHLIVGRSGNSQLVMLVGSLQIPVVMLRLYTIIDRKFVEAAHHQHLDIVKALLSGDGGKAERAMRRHIRSSKASVLERAKLLEA